MFTLITSLLAICYKTTGIISVSYNAFNTNKNNVIIGFPNYFNYNVRGALPGRDYVIAKVHAYRTYYKRRYTFDATLVLKKLLN